MKNDFDFIKEKVENSGVNAPEHMDENYVLDRIAGTRPQVVPIEAAPAQASRQAKKRRTVKWTAIAAVFVAAAVLATALTVHITRSKGTDPVKPSGSSSQVTSNSSVNGLIRFSSYDEVHEAVSQLRSRASGYRNGYYETVTDTVDEDYAAGSDYAGYLPKGVNDKVSGNAGASNGESAPDGASGESYSETYKQVEGVDEADIIKTDGRYIYVVENRYDDSAERFTSCVAVFKAEPGVTSPSRCIVPGVSDAVMPATEDEPIPNEATDDEPAPRSDDPDEPSATSDDCTVIELYLADNRMVILCRAGGYAYMNERGYAHAGSYYSVKNEIRAYVYDVADMEHIRLLDTFTQSGAYTSSRMIGGTLYLVTNDYDLDDIPCCGRGEEPGEIEAHCIYSIEDPSIESYLIVSAYNTADSSTVTDSKAVLGLGSDVYCSLNNLYISAVDYSRYYFNYTLDYSPEYKDGEDSVITYGGYDDPADNDAEDFFTPKTKIFKVSLDGGVSFTAYGEIEGYTNNQYSFDEYNGYLRVAATSNNADYEDVNNLYVLDGDLNIVGSVTGFAETESIKAVRYVGNTAYVITYEQTDPLFVIDLSRPTAPAILGEVKISGFSTMLVPVDENTILGLGINTGEVDYTTMEVQDGFKLALFDVSDKSHPQVLDSKAYVNFSSEVQYNPKALVYNPGRGDYIIPLNYYYWDSSTYYEDYDSWDDDGDWESFYDAHTDQYGAVLNFRIEGGRIVVNELHVTSHDEIDRCLYVGGTVYMVWYDDSGEAHLDSFSYR